MNGAELKATLKSGGRVFGTMISLNRNPRWAPVLDGVGLDYVIIDTEHSPRGRGELGDYLTMFNTTNVVPIVRIPIPDSHYVTMAIDAGAQGILAPYCETVDEAVEVVAAAKWRPLKGEAVRKVMATGEHISDSTRAYLEERNKNNVAIIGIESVAAVENLSNILEVPRYRRYLRRPERPEHITGIPRSVRPPGVPEHRQAHHRYRRSQGHRGTGPSPNAGVVQLLDQPRGQVHSSRYRPQSHGRGFQDGVRAAAAIRQGHYSVGWKADSRFRFPNPGPSGAAATRHKHADIRRMARRCPLRPSAAPTCIRHPPSGSGRVFDRKIG